MAIMKFGGKLLSNLFSKPATRNYPAEPREYPERSRGHLEFDPSDCILCGICSKKCPTHAITVDKPGRTFSVDRMLCIQCGYCSDSCPKSCLEVVPGYTEPGYGKVTDTIAVPERPKEKPESES